MISIVSLESTSSTVDEDFWKNTSRIYISTHLEAYKREKKEKKREKPRVRKWHPALSAHECQTYGSIAKISNRQKQVIDSKYCYRKEEKSTSMYMCVIANLKQRKQSTSSSSAYSRKRSFSFFPFFLFSKDNNDYDR